MRCFVGALLDGPSYEKLLAFTHTLKEQLENLNLAWTPPTNWHLTFHFLGNLKSENIESLLKGMSSIPSPSSNKLILNCLFLFPSEAKPTVLSIGATNAPPELKDYVELLSTPISSHQISIEKRCWKPHVTVARWRKNSRPLTQPIEMPVPPVPIQIEKVCLLESTEENGIRRYQSLGTICKL